MRLEETKLQAIKYTMMSIVLKHTKSFATDLILDFDRLTKWNNDGELPNKLIFIARENGVELGDENDLRIKYYLDGINRIIDKTEDLKIFEIDVEGVYNTEDIIWCTMLYNNEMKHDLHLNLFKQVYLNATTPLKW